MSLLPTRGNTNGDAKKSPRVSSSSPPKEVIVRDAYKEDSSIVIKWESETSNILGFRVVYRYISVLIIQKIIL